MKFSTAPIQPRSEFPLHRGKVAMYVAVIVMMIALAILQALAGQARMAEIGVIGVFVLLMCGYLAFVLIPYFKHRGPIVRITPGGLIDLRKGPEPLAWGDIKLAQVKRLAIGPGLKIQLENGRSFDVDFHLLEGRPEQAFMGMKPYLYPDLNKGEDEQEDD